MEIKMKAEHFRTRLNRLALLLAMLFVSHNAMGDALNHWHSRNPLPWPWRINAFAQGNGRMVAVAHGGGILTADDGTNWVVRTSGETRDIRSIVFDGVRFVAVASDSFFRPAVQGVYALVSTNGIEWSRNWITSGRLDTTAIAYGQNRYVALLCENYYLCTPFVSTDAGSWSPVAPLIDVEQIGGLVFANNRFVAVGTGTEGGLSLVSTNGLDWTRASVEHPLTSIIHVQGTFYATAERGIFLSEDGVTWTSASSDGILTNTLVSAIAWSGDRFIAHGRDLLNRGRVEVVSTNGFDWSGRIVEDIKMTHALSWTGDKFLAGSYAGWIAWSADGLSWTNNVSLPVAALLGVASSPDRIVVVGGGANTFTNPAFPARVVFTSSNAVDWSCVLCTNRPALFSVAHSPHGFAAVGETGSVLTSPDGVTWTERDSPTTNRLRTALFGGNKFVAVGHSGTVLASPDGTAWSLKNSGVSARLWDIAYSGARYVAVGDHGTVIWSSDGETWTPASSGTVLTLYAVAYGNGRFVAMGSTNLWSEDGVLWHPGAAYIPGLVSVIQPDVLYVNGVFFSRGGSGLASVWNGGPTWVPRTIPHNMNPECMLEYQGTVLTVGLNGEISQSDPFQLPELQGEAGTNGFHVRVTGEPDRIFRLQYATNLGQWHDLHSWAPSGETNEFLDATAPAEPTRFYRVVSP